MIEKLKERLATAILQADQARGETTIVIGREQALEVFKTLRNEPGFEFNMLSDLSAVDWPERKPRFEVIYHLNSLALRHRLRVKILLDDGPEAWTPTVSEIWKAADWLERECFDMFGIQFHGHPDLRRILMYDSFEGHPLRKDYPYQRRQPIVPETDPVVKPLRMSR